MKQEPLDIVEGTLIDLVDLSHEEDRPSALSGPSLHEPALPLQKHQSGPRPSMVSESPDDMDPRASLGPSGSGQMDFSKLESYMDRYFERISRTMTRMDSRMKALEQAATTPVPAPRPDSVQVMGAGPAPGPSGPHASSGRPVDDPRHPWRSGKDYNIVKGKLLMYDNRTFELSKLESSPALESWPNCFWRFKFTISFGAKIPRETMLSRDRAQVIMADFMDAVGGRLITGPCIDSTQKLWLAPTIFEPALCGKSLEHMFKYLGDVDAPEPKFEKLNEYRLFGGIILDEASSKMFPSFKGPRDLFTDKALETNVASKQFGEDFPNLTTALVEEEKSARWQFLRAVTLKVSLELMAEDPTNNDSLVTGIGKLHSQSWAMETHMFVVCRHKLSRQVFTDWDLTLFKVKKFILSSVLCKDLFPQADIDKFCNNTQYLTNTLRARWVKIKAPGSASSSSSGGTKRKNKGRTGNFAKRPSYEGAQGSPAVNPSYEKKGKRQFQRQQKDDKTKDHSNHCLPV